jgi:hypothetical protein
MTQRRRPVSSAQGRALAWTAPRGGWRAMASEEVRWIGAWWSAWMGRAFEWLLQLGRPTAATILEMHNVKRRIPEIGEIDQAVQSLHNRDGRDPHSKTPGRRPRPFDS